MVSPAAIGVCGWSNSGKTTLIERAVPILSQCGLRIAVLKHSEHGFEIDRSGKDSDRFFQTGADVYMHSPRESFARSHPGDGFLLDSALDALSEYYDLILVEGHKSSPVSKIWLCSEGETSPPPEASNVLQVLPRDSDRLELFLSLIRSWLARLWEARPVFGCLLIGGRSVRMGTPKHLLRREGRTWMSRTVALLESVTSKVVLVGEGRVPAGNACIRLRDVPDARGPMAGLLAAMRWAPRASWVVAACDLPCLSEDALRWLVAQRTPGTWAIIPSSLQSGRLEPLLAHYDFRSRHVVERLSAAGDFSLAHVADHPKTAVPTPPIALASSWWNVNTPQDLLTLDQSCGLARWHTDL